MHPCDNIENLLRVLEPPRRNNYFYGKRMDVQHFQMEQDYGKLKQWLVNRLTFGKGVVCGLKVSLDGNLICVDPGFAIDGLGREIIVPVRACIDPVTQEGGCCTPCCNQPAATPAPEPQPQPQPQPQPGGLSHPAAAVGPAPQPQPQPQPQSQPPYADGVFTLWLCYRECRTDYQPVLVSDCGTRDQCAPGTLVETFCLKVTPGVPPLQNDPDWCAKLWAKKVPGQPQPGASPDMTGLTDNVPATPDRANLANVTNPAANLPSSEQVSATLTSRRYLLCGLLDGQCDPSEGDPCVPLALMLLRDKRVVRFDTCLVRPRVYSNEVLLELILCLAGKIDECCNHKEPPVAELMRVKSVEFLGGPNDDQVIAAVQSPLGETTVPIRQQGRSIRVKFTQAFDQGANKPETPGLNDANWKRYNFLVTPEGGPAFGLDYVPGSLAIEAPDTLRWDLNPETPFYGRAYKGWQKGRLRLTIYGDPDAAAGRLPMTNTANAALDGEPIAPAGGVMSGDGSPGGTFTTTFQVG
jgi:hypothetical protein